MHERQIYKRYIFKLNISFIVTILLYTTTAFAHSEQGVAGGLLSGLLHPTKGLDHLVAMVAVGLWGAQLGNPAI